MINLEIGYLEQEGNGGSECSLEDNVGNLGSGSEAAHAPPSKKKKVVSEMEDDLAWNILQLQVFPC